jgi:hypothetical protein
VVECGEGLRVEIDHVAGFVVAVADVGGDGGRDAEVREGIVGGEERRREIVVAVGGEEAQVQIVDDTRRAPVAPLRMKFSQR